LRAMLACLDFPPAIGGIQTMLGSLAERLAPWELTVVCPDAPGAAAWDRQQPFRVLRAPAVGFGGLAGRSLPGIAAQAAAAALRERPDVLLCGHPALGPVGQLLRRGFRVPFVLFTYAMELRHPRLRLLLPAAFREAARVVTISRSCTREVRGLGCPEAKIRQLALGFEPGRFAGVEPSRLPEELGLTGRPWLLTVTRLVERYKGVDTMIRALPLIAARAPEVRYVVAGDGNLHGYLERLARSVGCAERVHFLGRVSQADLAALYGGCTAMALMSRDRTMDGGAEGFGLVFLEANSFGKPVLGGNSGGIPDAVVDGVTGLLADPESIGSVAEATGRLLTDPALAARLGEQGRERALHELTWTACAGQLKEIVEDVLAEKRPAPSGRHDAC